MNKSVSALVVGLLLSGSALAADTYILDFNPSSACAPDVTTCSSNSQISQSYGDVTGVVDVTFIDVNDSSRSLNWWDSAYNDLIGVAWASGNDSHSHARIELKALDGKQVTLNSMDFGAWSYWNRLSNISVRNADTGTTLFSYAGNIGSGATIHNSFSPAASASRLWIDWYDSAYNVGIDNVNFTVATVPEPETYALFLAGLGILGAVARRQQKTGKI